MSTEQILKFQPDRTLYLRGVDGAGAAAALLDASPTGFSLCGVFRDMADFCVLVIYDADNIFEHYSLRYLPDFNLSGMVLTFDYTSNGLQPLDSVKYSWIDWGILDVLTLDGAPFQIPLFPLATLKSGNFAAASSTVTIHSTGATVYDRLTLFVNNAGFDFIAIGGESAAAIAANLAYQINTHDWPSFASASVSVIASAAGNALTLTNAQTGHVMTSGTTVSWVDGQRFVGLTPGMQICLSGFFYIIASVDSATQLTLTSAPGLNAGGGLQAPYTAPRGGVDGNSLTAYVLVRSANVSLSVDKTVLPFAGGTSDGLTWTVSIDFSKELGVSRVSQVRQAWLTFAPQLPASSPYQDTEWNVTVANWTTTDADGIGIFQIAGPDSSRIGNADSNCSYSANDWTVLSQNNYWRGFGRQASTVGASVTVSYSCGQTHDLYLGTSLMNGRGAVSIEIDGVPLAAALDCSLKVDSELVTRRLLQRGVTAGDHVVKMTITATGTFVFDYLEAAVATSEISDAAVTYANVSPALDFDTDATYKMSPQRLLWHIRKLGFYGHMNEYLGVFWWNQRKRVAAVWNSAVIDVGGNWQSNDSAKLTFGPIGVASEDFSIYKSVISTDTAGTIADHFVYYINSATVAVWAEITGPGQFTIHTRTPSWGEGLQVQANSAGGTLTLVPGTSIDAGDPGHWQVDPSAVNPLNFAVRSWHSDLFKGVQAAGMLITTSFSMELVYPPDDGQPGNEWTARYYDGTPVETDTGFANLISSQCTFIPNMTAFQQKVYTSMAALQSAAGLTPWLQFGEFLWWFFSSLSANIYTLNGTTELNIQLSQPDKRGTQVVIPHGMSSGDRVVVTGVSGCAAANGTWRVTVVDATTFSIPAVADGAWISGTGNVRGGTMAYYDAATKSAAQAKLGRDLYRFTCQDDDPGVNGGADGVFLASQLKSHIDSISSAVLAHFPNAKFEILYPNDVNNPVCLSGAGVPYSQGGRLNAVVNFPKQWLAQAGSGLDSFKVEALSWSATYMDMDRAHEAIVFAVTHPMAWSPVNVAYLVPWFNGTCPWPREFLLAATRGLSTVNFWAYDHLSLMSWPVPLPFSMQKSTYLG